MYHNWPTIDWPLMRRIVKENKKYDYKEFGSLYLNKSPSTIYKTNFSFSDVFKSLIVNNNYDSFKKLIQLLVFAWRNEIKIELEKSLDFDMIYAQSLHYKSPGVGMWFRVTDLIPDNALKTNIFEDDKTIFRVYEQLYTQIPEKLNISFENNSSKDTFSIRNIIRIKKCDCVGRARNHVISKKQYYKTNIVDLPFCCLRAMDDDLKGISLEILIEKSRQQLGQDPTNDEIKLPKELENLREYFTNSIKSLDILRFVLSAYIVIRSSKRLETILNADVEKEFIIDFYPLNGPVSTMKKEGSWILFYTRKTNPKNHEQYQNFSLRLTEYWSLIRGSDINGALSIKERYWSLNVERLLSELLCINRKIVEKENILLENVFKHLLNDNKSKISNNENKFYKYVNDQRKEADLKEQMKDSKIIGFIDEFVRNNPQSNKKLLLKRLEIIRDFGLLKINGCNELYLNFIEKLRETSINGKKEPISIFLYSGPGTGKETISRLIHLWSRSSYFNDFSQVDNLKEFLRNNLKDLVENEEFEGINRYFELVHVPKDKLIHQIDTEDTCLASIERKLMASNDTKYSEKAASIIKKVKKLKENEAEESFFSINCSLLTRDNFSKLLFGSITKPNGMLKAALYSGTCFFDEFNTLEVGLENNLLKLLVEPNEAIIKLNNDSKSDEVARIQKFNNLYVFASNLRPEELLKRGYNSAVISRITQYYFEIPSLKYRKEDMLLAFISQLAKIQEKNTKVDWKMVDTTALQFLCMLPWNGNYRDLEGFANDLFNERKLRSIFNEVLSFREVVECAVRRGLIG